MVQTADVCPVAGSSHTIGCERYVIYSDRLDSYRDSGRDRSIANECAELQRQWFFSSRYASSERVLYVLCYYLISIRLPFLCVKATDGHTGWSSGK